MAFHVDGGSPRLRVQRGLDVPGRDHLLRPRKRAPDDASAAKRDAGDQVLV